MDMDTTYMRSWKPEKNKEQAPATLEKEARPGGKSLDAKKSHNRTKEPGPWWVKKMREE